MVDWGGGVFAGCSRGSNVRERGQWIDRIAPQHHWLLPINCHFRDCEARCTGSPCKLRYIRIRPLPLPLRSMGLSPIRYTEFRVNITVVDLRMYSGKISFSSSCGQRYRCQIFCTSSMKPTVRSIVILCDTDMLRFSSL